MITELHINENGLRKRLFKNATIYFHPKINFLIGENGSGKSTILNELILEAKRTQTTLKYTEKRGYMYFDSEKMNPRIKAWH